MKKYLFFLILFLISTGAANAQTTSFYIYGGPNIISDCEVPPPTFDSQGNEISGSCVQKYYTDGGYLSVTVDGQSFTPIFDGEPRCTALFMANQFVYYIENALNVNVSVYDYGNQVVRVDIDGSHTLSGLAAVETNPDWIAYAGPTSWWTVTATYP